MKAIYDIPAPAKLNLFLHITGRRTDGYHLLQSVFMLIDWCDTLHVELRSDGLISREDLGAALPPEDLVLRAARALQAASGCSLGAHIGIEKRIPAEAGMGGGSSDAATTLIVLNRLWGLNWPRARLQELALELAEQEVQELLEQMAPKVLKELQELERHRELPAQVMRVLQVILDQVLVQQMQVL